MTIGTTGKAVARSSKLQFAELKTERVLITGRIMLGTISLSIVRIVHTAYY